MQRFFDRSAPGWDERTGAGSADHLAGLGAALLHVRPAPERALEVGTGTGEGALLIAREFPQARVRGVDISDRMIEAATGKVGLDPEGRIAFRVADAARLPYEAESFDLVAHLNMPPFVREIARVLRPGGQVIVASSWGAAARSTRPTRSWTGDSPSGESSRQRPVRRRRAHIGSGESRPCAARFRFRPMDGARRHLVLVNPSAGGGRARRLLPQLESSLNDLGLEYRVVITTSVEHGCQEARTGAANGEVPVVMSGDGLVGQVGGVLAGGEVPMGVIPGGRGNDFARVVGIPTEITAAARLLASGGTRAIDVGEVNGRRFLCIASCGFDAEANRIANEARFVKGNLVYAYAALRALVAWRSARFELTLDGERHEVCGYSVAAANSKAYGGGMFLAPDAVLDDGQLDVGQRRRGRKAPLPG